MIRTTVSAAIFASLTNCTVENSTLGAAVFLMSGPYNTHMWLAKRALPIQDCVPYNSSSFGVGAILHMQGHHTCDTETGLIWKALYTASNPTVCYVDKQALKSDCGLIVVFCLRGHVRVTRTERHAVLRLLCRVCMISLV